MPPPVAPPAFCCSLSRQPILTLTYTPSSSWSGCSCCCRSEGLDLAEADCWGMRHCPASSQMLWGSGEMTAAAMPRGDGAREGTSGVA